MICTSMPVQPSVRRHCSAQSATVIGTFSALWSCVYGQYDQASNG